MYLLCFGHYTALREFNIGRSTYEEAAVCILINIFLHNYGKKTIVRKIKGLFHESAV